MYDASGLAVGAVKGHRPKGSRGEVVLLDPDRLLFTDLSVLHLSSRAIDHLGEGRLAGWNADGATGQVCDGTGCTLTVYDWAGNVLRSARIPATVLSGVGISAAGQTGRVGLTKGGLLTPDGRALVFGWLDKVTEPGEVRRLDLTTGQVATLFRADGFIAPAALTQDGGTALVSLDSRIGAFQLISLADPTRTAIIEFGAHVTAITAGPSFKHSQPGR